MSSHIVSEWSAYAGFKIIMSLVSDDYDPFKYVQSYVNLAYNHGPIPVCIVGSNPSRQSPDCSAFHPDTKSRKVVDSWFEGQNVFLSYINIIPEKTEGNRQLTKKDMKPHLETLEDKLRYEKNIVACGRIASMGLNMAGIDHFNMPHPSGLNRFWNDKEAGEKKIKEMLSWIRRLRL
jgi:hypothetical protein